MKKLFICLLFLFGISKVHNLFSFPNYMVQRLSSEEKINPSLAEIRKQREEIYLSIKEKEIELQELELKELELRRLKINEEELKNRERLENMIIELQERIDLNKKELKNRIQKNQE